jgi:ubiquinone/menaquinone biosynthesis C-methylase UbiE
MKILNNWTRKISNVLRSQFARFNENFHYRRVALKTTQLKKKNKSDFERWIKSSELHENWDERTKILASMVQPNSKVIEFGAGAMNIKNWIPNTCNYTASDIVARKPDVLACDLNKNIPFELTVFDTAIFSGVLEYVFDIDKVFFQLNNSIDHILLSYACKDISNANRLKNGWLSDYSRKELEDIFRKYEYKITEYKEWKNQSIFNLSRIKDS